MPSTEVMALPSPVAGLRQYIQLTERFPELDAEEERSLAERLQREGDVHAAWRLVTSHLRYVVRIARGYRGYGLPVEDLIQEGNIGLMKAVRRFDPSRGVRLLAYAVHWIRAEIHEFILKNWRIVKVATTKARRKLFYKLRGAKRRLEWLTAEEAGNIAETLDVRPQEVADMEARLYLSDEPFDPPAGAADEERWTPAAYLADGNAEPETVVAETEFLHKASDALDEALASLDERSREIVERRWLVGDRDRLTLRELGEKHGISAERVRQLEAEAIGRLRGMLAPRLGVRNSGGARAA